MGQYSIKEVEALSGIRAHTLRIWEQRYGFLSPQRTDTNIRFYTDEQLKLILNIALLNKKGYKISKIAEMGAGELSRLILELGETEGGSEVLFESMIHAMIDFDEQRFEKTLNQAIVRMGFTDAFEKLILPFMERTGLLWCTGIIKPVQEHFISNLIRRKLCVAIDNQFSGRAAHGRRFVLFLPEGEWHELLLLYTELLLRMQGHEVIYLGCSVPMDDIFTFGGLFKPDCLVSYITSPLQHMTLPDLITRLSDSYPEQRILIGGPQPSMIHTGLPSNVSIIRSSHDLLLQIGSVAMV